ncbi:MAG: 3-methyl-2-oxobutanoate hydroxymethyltransferase [Calditrichaeota bacterium]|nr:MAG: 3-methyl-2-oxobutanoate hydroxymethyltransferase [Calditrichota bacterium]
MSVHKEHPKMTVPRLIAKKAKGEQIAALTAYDTLMAEILDESGIDVILVGDSAAMVMAGHSTTLPITMEEMLFYTRNVRRGVKKALLVADMPFLSYQCSLEEGIRNAGRFLKEAGAEAVKIEGGEPVVELIARLVDFGIPVMGHLGLTPQSIHKFGSYKLQGKESAVAKKLKKEAKMLEEAGIFSLVLEKIPAGLAREITETIKVPTIGIGAGVHCDGQILVAHDMLGIYDKMKPRFVRRYAEIAQTMRQAFDQYIDDVRNRRFPSDEESFL